MNREAGALSPEQLQAAERQRDRVRNAIQAQLHHFHLAYERWGKDVHHPHEVIAAEYAVADAAIAAVAQMRGEGE